MKESSFIKLKNKVRLFFKMDDLQTPIKKELIGGLTTFLAGLYLLSNEPYMFISTFIMCLVSNMPVVISPSMGIYSVFTFSVAKTVGYEGTLIAVMISSILFCAISSTGLKMLSEINLNLYCHHS